jgi:hypothetical protein
MIDLAAADRAAALSGLVHAWRRAAPAKLVSALDTAKLA